MAKDSIRKEHWNVGNDLHESVDHSDEFVIRDESSLSRMPPDLNAWASQNCEFRLYYAYGGYGGSDSKVREFWQRYRAAIPMQETASGYRILRVLIGLERPLWVAEHCRSSWEEIDRQKEHEREVSGAGGAQPLPRFWNTHGRRKFGDSGLTLRCRIRRLRHVRNRRPATM